jgi:DNA-directed RNA polymerase specialized sigma subunit
MQRPFEEIVERARDYYKRPHFYKNRNRDIVEMAKVEGGQMRAAEKYGITKQRVSQIVQASSHSA